MNNDTELAGGTAAVLLTPELQEYEFERQFDDRGALEWMQQNWTRCFAFSAIYVMLIFGGQYLMRERTKFELRKPLILWSLTLALFSILGALRTGWYMWQVLTTSGFKQSVCDRSFYSAPVSKFWAYMFVLSKAPELGDTVFIILRKQKLIFLHWYHHITVLLYSWYTYKDRVSGGGWFMTMNFAVHAVMYSYYTLRAAQVPLPRSCAMLITVTQISQMVMGMVVNALVYNWMGTSDCFSHSENILWSSVMYLSYLYLFCSFFYSTYLKSSKGVKVD
ncbi:elongation of very long chain fatty acids protein 6-like [Protopterus annectens]|uniref:elongation of very long chain fatty acids protein 6-like n=1 Tax=Protopterus annectens TaxID=7888 RepID=UPI001CFC39B0|nr:elongation of very long chain fatty acids protein 6-like [Protopterus annectens]